MTSKKLKISDLLSKDRPLPPINRFIAAILCGQVSSLEEAGKRDPGFASIAYLINEFWNAVIRCDDPTEQRNKLHDLVIEIKPDEIQRAMFEFERGVWDEYIERMEQAWPGIEVDESMLPPSDDDELQTLRDEYQKRNALLSLTLPEFNARFSASNKKAGTNTEYAEAAFRDIFLHTASSRHTSRFNKFLDAALHPTKNGCTVCLNNDVLPGLLDAALVIAVQHADEEITLSLLRTGKVDPTKISKGDWVRAFPNGPDNQELSRLLASRHPGYQRWLQTRLAENQSWKPLAEIAAGFNYRDDETFRKAATDFFTGRVAPKHVSGEPKSGGLDPDTTHRGKVRLYVLCWVAAHRKIDRPAIFNWLTNGGRSPWITKRSVEQAVQKMLDAFANDFKKKASKGTEFSLTFEQFAEQVLDVAWKPDTINLAGVQGWRDILPMFGKDASPQGAHVSMQNEHSS